MNEDTSAVAGSSRRCKTCETPLPEWSRVGRPPQYCSIDCRRTQQYWKQRAEAALEIAGHNTVVRTCAAPDCDKQFHIPSGWRGGRRYCSATCRPSSQQQRPVHDPRACAQCGTDFTPPTRTGPVSKYCSPRCRNKAKAPAAKSRYVAVMQTARTAICEMCQQEYTFIGRSRKYCSDECDANSRRLRHSQRANGTPLDCQRCGKMFPSTRSRYVYCSPQCSKAAYRAAKAERDADKNHVRRIRYAETATERIDRRRVYERDKWRCQLCRKKVDPAKQWPHPMSASLDHVLPISKGGEHTYANVQLAHLSCNSKKNDGGSQQLALIG